LQVFVYLAGLQLLLTSGRKSVLVMVASTLAGVLYRLNLCGVRRLRVSSSSSSSSSNNNNGSRAQQPLATQLMSLFLHSTCGFCWTSAWMVSPHALC
jgi:hypothetical protein